MNSPSQTGDLIEAYLDALRSGDVPSVRTFAARHPKEREELESLLPLIREAEDARFSGIAREAAATEQTRMFPRPLGPGLVLLRQIGSGGMGMVYEAEQPLLKRRCAVKVLSPVYSRNSVLRETFTHEAQFLARLRHPNIVPVHSADSANGCLFYTMELIEGPPLRLLATTAEAVADIGLQAARALAHAHNFGILHCDVKPSNLLADTDGTVMLSDFGLAQLLTSPTSHTGGTLRYMAPERLRREPFTESSDQYSLGMTLRELLTGEPPRKQPDSEILRLRDALPPLPPLPSGCPADLRAIVGKMTASDPAHRYGSMAQAADDLRNFLEHRPVTALPASVFRRLRLGIRRRPLTAAAYFLAFFCILGAAASLALGHVRTHRAYLRAERNAQLAQTALNRLFHHINTSVPSKAGTRLLVRMLPYYKDLLRRKALPPEALGTAYKIVGTSAMRSGQYALAAEALGKLCQLDSSPENDELHALALYRLSLPTAGAVNNALIDRYKNSSDPRTQLTVLVALKRGSMAYPGSRALAVHLLRGLLRDIPDLPMLKMVAADYRRQYPDIAEEAGLPPSGDLPDGAISDTYLHLTDRQRAIPLFGMRLLNYTSHLMAAAQTYGDVPPSLLRSAKNEAERLAGEMQGVPGIASTVMNFWTDCCKFLHRCGSGPEAEAFDDHLYSLLSILYHERDTKSIYQPGMMWLLTYRIRNAVRRGNRQEVFRLGELFDSKIKHYNGSDKQEMVKKVQNLLRHPETGPGLVY